MDSVMSWRNKKVRGLMVALAVGLCGCAAWPSRGRQAGVQSTAPPTPPPPQPAAALYIPTPPKGAVTDSAITQVSAPVQDPEALPALTPTKNATAAQPEPVIDQRARLADLYQKAADRVSRMNSYIMRLKRREVVQGRKRPEEIMLVKFRREPFSVYLKWLGPEAKDREVIYVKGRFDNLIHTKVASGDIPLIPAGKRFSLPPDSILARSSSRHPITTAGLAHLVDQFGQLVSLVNKGDTHRGTLQYLGTLNRPEFPTPVEGVMQLLRPGNDALLPGGGRRLWYFDTHSHLPVLLIAHDENQREVEYYCHDRVQFPVGLDDDDFNPDKLWGKRP